MWPLIPNSTKKKKKNPKIKLSTSSLEWEASIDHTQAHTQARKIAYAVTSYCIIHFQRQKWYDMNIWASRVAYAVTSYCIVHFQRHIDGGMTWKNLSNKTKKDRPFYTTQDPWSHLEARPLILYLPSRIILSKQRKTNPVVERKYPSAMVYLLDQLNITS